MNSPHRSAYLARHSYQGDVKHFTPTKRPGWRASLNAVLTAPARNSAPELHECLFRTPHPAACSWTTAGGSLRHCQFIRHPILFVPPFTTGKARFHYRPCLPAPPLFLAENAGGRMNGPFYWENTDITPSYYPEPWQTIFCGQPPARTCFSVRHGKCCSATLYLMNKRKPLPVWLTVSAVVQQHKILPCITIDVLLPQN